MKRVLAIYIILLAAVGAYGQASTSGKDFWLSFGNNDFSLYTRISLQVRIVTQKNTQATITFTETGEVISLSLSADTVYTHNLTDVQKQAVYSDVTGRSSKSIRIQTNENVSVYAVNLKRGSTDATAILPAHALGNSYYHLSYSPAPDNRDGYTIVATENNTTVAENGVAKAVLHKGEVYSSYFTDDSKRHITTNRPVAYFVTNSCAWVPLGMMAYDCFYQQLYAVSLWGNRFFVPVTVRGKERVRVIASEDNTVISLTDGTLITGSLTLNEGEWAEIEISADQNGCYIEANHPVGVASYLIGSSDSRLSRFLGDPAMAWIPPIEQSIGETLVAPFLAAGSSVLTEHHLMIVVPTSAKNLTEMKQGSGNYAALTGGSWHDHSSGYSYYTLPLSSSDVSYGFKNPAGLIVLMYGLGDDESYYYVAGAATRKLNAYFEVDGVHHQSFQSGSLCDGDVEVDIGASIRYEMDPAPGHLRWQLNGVEQTALTDKLYWDVELPMGNHTIRMIAKNKTGELDTITLSFAVGMRKTTYLTDAICQNQPYEKYGFSLLDDETEKPGTFAHQLNLLTALGCDSIVYLDLLVYPAEEITIDDTVCQGVSYSEYGFSLLPEDVPGSYTHQQIWSNIYGCDSIITLNLTVEPTYQKTFTARIPVNEPYNDNGFSVPPQSKPGFFTFKENLYSPYGCDSLVILNLTVYAEIIPDKDFSPNGDGVNDVWNIKNIEYFEVISVDIYNRFGKLLVRHVDRFVPWDGNYFGKAMPSGDYWYVITLNEKAKQYVGHFTLLR